MSINMTSRQNGRKTYLRLALLALSCFCGEESRVDVWYDTTLRNDDIAEEFGKFFVISEYTYE
jgi:hypothetical protein